MSLHENRVVIASTHPVSELGLAPTIDTSEPSDRPAYDPDTIRSLVTRLFMESGMDSARAGSAKWNPLGEIIRPGDRVLVKPNWVHHRNRSGAGLESLITQATVVGGVLDFVARSSPAEVIVADAPIQGCDLPKMLSESGYDRVREAFAAAGAPVEWRDLRRTVLKKTAGKWTRHSDLRPLEQYVLFDVGSHSLLEPISDDAERFRVTMYNPDLMRATHAPGRHQYLIAREAIEADVIINLPKLKTHKKAGITGALKNLVGINGNKDYLPHHRLGGSTTGGDCYEGGNRLKLLAELLVDGYNRREGLSAQLFRQAERAAYGLIKLTGMDTNLDGSWHGNDTVWRMSLDLNRVLRYGRTDGSLAHEPQRRIVSITDAVVCGEGEGPLAPTPRRLGMLSLARNSAAAELAHAHVMGFDWEKIPIVREAFGRFAFPICEFAPEDVELQINGAIMRRPWPELGLRVFQPPEGWRGHCESERRPAPGRAEDRPPPSPPEAA